MLPLKIVYKKRKKKKKKIVYNVTLPFLQLRMSTCSTVHQISETFPDLCVCVCVCVCNIPECST